MISPILSYFHALMNPRVCPHCGSARVTEQGYPMTEQPHEPQFPERNFMVEVSNHKTHEKTKFYPDGDYLFATSWLSQKHPFGYQVDYFSTLEDAQSAIEKCKITNPQKEGYWLTFTIYSITDVTRSRLHPPADTPTTRCCESCKNIPCKPLNRIPCVHHPENPCIENGCTDIENCDEICEHSRIFSPAWVKQHDAAIRNETLSMVIRETIESCSSEEPYVPNMIECGGCPFFILYDEGIDCVMKSLRSTPTAQERDTQ